jgi:hypothetical protein
VDTSKPLEDQVRERAYALWEQDGRPDGRPEDYWHRAEAELDAQDAEPGAELPSNVAGESNPGAVTE